MTSPPIGPSDYYETLPSAEHCSGDVWSNLPTHGMIGPAHLPSVVITPACDLVNRKVDTLTYIPLLPVRDYLVSRGHLMDSVRAIDGQLQAAGLPILRSRNTAAVPDVGDLRAARELICEGAPTFNAKQRAAGERAHAGLAAIERLIEHGEMGVNVEFIRTLYGPEFRQLVQRIVTNAHRPDLHFLPPDEQQSTWSLITEPSVLLFRYPMTVPIDIMDLANHSDADSWPGQLARIRPIYPGADSLARAWPVKVLRIRPRFLSDILARFVGLYGRIGSPDFPETRIERYVDRLGGVA